MLKYRLNIVNYALTNANICLNYHRYYFLKRWAYEKII
jgi:hypothetical protein